MRSTTDERILELTGNWVDAELRADTGAAS
jgi:hypothetical protein